jgi:dTDP-glucose 4,6-dehydratase
MQILVIGGAGFIGTNFVKMISREEDYSVTVLDKLTYAGRKENLEGLNIDFIHGDITDHTVVDNAVKGKDAVINFAAETHVDRSIKDPSSFLRTNVFGVFNVLEAVRKFDVKRLIQISTDEVYGPIEKGSFSESDILNPTNPYSASKAGAEHLCFSYATTYGLPVLITRSSNNFGPYQYPEKLVPMIITSAMADRPINLYGDGSGVRDWIFVEDNCSGIMSVLKNGKTGQIYNIGAGNERTNLEVTKAILKILGKPETLIKFVAERPGHDKRYSMVFDRINTIGWKTKYSFDTGLAKTVEWYSHNRQWWSSL